MKEAFRKFSRGAAVALGSPWAFALAFVISVLWAVTGPSFHYSDAWQLIANTVTNVVTFLMVFIIQSSQNRDSTAMQLKLDELLRAIEGARTGLVNLESLSDEDLDQLQREFERLGKRNKLASRATEGDSTPSGA